MALVDADSLSDPFPLSDSLERVPDSSPLRVSLNTQLESGIPPARLRSERETSSRRGQELTLDDGLQLMESALADVTRTEANLGLLVRGLKHLATGASAARDANTELIHELEELRAHLSRGHEEDQALRFRMSQLEQLLDVIRHESSRERQFLIEQQDLFFVQLMTDHERQIADLQRQLQESSARKGESPEIAELIAQRDQAREYATRCERERDAAWHELATGQAPPPSPVPVAAARRSSLPPPLPAELASPTSNTTSAKSGATAIGSINLRAVQVPAASVPEAERKSATGYSLSGEKLDE